MGCETAGCKIRGTVSSELAPVGQRKQKRRCPVLSLAHSSANVDMAPHSFGMLPDRVLLSTLLQHSMAIRSVQIYPRWRDTKKLLK